MKTIPELLSPVGGRAQLEAAINNGADAVYMGGSLFNARINAENFTDESLESAIGFAHERGVKVYITFNTLLKDSELERALRYACRLYEMGADALIVQDMGLARLVHKYLPDFPLHLSTQGTVYNTQALDLVRNLGFRRVVPARELSLEEIGRLCAAAHGDAVQDAAPLEIEVFVHGALCMCYSGQCQLSRAFGGGGRSGNRGLCAQPCRLPYTDDKGRTGYFLSPKDLCALELLPQLIEAGVDSFKIEGRLKSPEYVAVVTAVYRKYLNLYAEAADTAGAAAAAGATGGKGIIGSDEWKSLIDPEDKRKLLQIFNRGGFTAGYLEGNPGQKILSGESPKNQGIYLGTVEAVRPVKSKSGSRDKVLADVTLKGSRERVIQGDGVEIRGRVNEAGAVTGNVITYAEQLLGGLLRIGDFDRGIRAGDRVYKVTDKALREEALSASAKRLPVSMKFRAHIGSAPVLEMSLKEKARAADPGSVTGPDITSRPIRICTSRSVRERTSRSSQICTSRHIRVFGDFAVEPALHKPIDEQKIRSQLMKLGDSCFAADEADVKVEADQDIMIPVSVINQMRREAAEALASALRNEVTSARGALLPVRIEEIISSEQLGNEDELRRVENRAAASKRKPVPVRDYCAGGTQPESTKLESTQHESTQPESTDGASLPYILNISKGGLDDYIEENFNAIVHAVRDTGILIGNLGWVKQFLDAGVNVYGDYGLNAYNSQAVRAYEEMGVEMLYPSHECNDGGRGTGMHAADPRFDGRIPLMITEHPFDTDYLVDRKGVKHEIIQCSSRDKYLFF